MFGIGAGEFIFIVLIILMFFGSDKIPEMARALGKGMAHLKNATNDIKSEIHKNVGDSGFDVKSLTGGISEEISKAKEGLRRWCLNRPKNRKSNRNLTLSAKNSSLQKTRLRHRRMSSFRRKAINRTFPNL